LKDLQDLPIARALIADLLPENLVIENLAIENLVIAEVQIELVQDLQEVELVAREMICAKKIEE
jgi:hypothetical protein